MQNLQTQNVPTGIGIIKSAFPVLQAMSSTVKKSAPLSVINARLTILMVFALPVS
jgi:hypothetical protein